MSRQLALQHKHKAAGLCVYCSEPRSDESKSFCARHLEKARERQGVKTPRNRSFSAMCRAAGVEVRRARYLVAKGVPIAEALKNI